MKPFEIHERVMELIEKWEELYIGYDINVSPTIVEGFPHVVYLEPDDFTRLANELNEEVTVVNTSDNPTSFIYMLKFECEGVKYETFARGEEDFKGLEVKVNENV